VTGVVAALGLDTAYDVVNLGSSRPIALRTVIETLEQALERRAAIDWLPDQPGDIRVTYADISKAGRLLGYRPATPFEEGSGGWSSGIGSSAPLNSESRIDCGAGTARIAAATLAPASRVVVGRHRCSCSDLACVLEPWRSAQHARLVFADCRSDRIGAVRRSRAGAENPGEPMDGDRDGEVFASGDAAALKNSLLAVGQDEEQRARYAAAGRRRLEERHRFDRIADAYEELYRRLTFPSQTGPSRTSGNGPA